MYEMKSRLINLIHSEKWEETRKKRAEAGRKGGKQTQANASSAKQNQANQAVNVNVNDNVISVSKDTDVYKSSAPFVNGHKDF